MASSTKLTELARVGEFLALEGGEISTGNTRSEAPGTMQYLRTLALTGPTFCRELQWRGTVTVKGPGPLECVGNTRGCEASAEKTEVIVSSEVSFTLILGNAIGSPDLSRTPEILRVSTMLCS
jgi:hypothetical protein